MAAVKPFRFGVIAENMTTHEAWLAKARRAEALGYATLLIRDHFSPDYFGHQFAPIAAMMAAAAATTTLRLGTMVIDNDFRHPALLAKEAATIDLLSGGRLELGLGAGWLESEYRQTGIAYDPPGVRIARLIESVQLLKGLFGGEPVHFSGEHYRIDGLVGFPLPAQRPYPPILIGGGGKRILAFAGKEADIAGVLTTSVGSGVVVDNPLERLSSRIAEKIGWIRDGAGARFDRIELSLIASVTVATNRRAATEALIANRGWNGVTVEQVWDMPSTLIGTAEEIAAQLVGRRESLGFSYVVVDDATMEPFAPVVKRLADR
jgi:probable F420-dependent oxidoreductase